MYMYTGYPYFTAVEPNVNPLPSCLEDGKRGQNARVPIPGKAHGLVYQHYFNPGYLTLPGKMFKEHMS